MSNENVRVETFRAQDGRYGEKRISLMADGSETVTEVWEEDRPLNLKQRIREVKKPVVVERVVETINGDQVVEKKIEAIDGEKQTLRLIDHIGLAQPEVTAQSNESVSREELEGHITNLVDGLRDVVNSVVSQPEEPRLVRAQSLVEEETKKASGWGTVEITLLCIVAAEAAYLAMKVLPQYINF